MTDKKTYHTWNIAMKKSYLHDVVKVIVDMNYTGFSVLILALLVNVGVYGQGGNNSPFSRYGIGDLRIEDGINTRLMGGIGIAHLDIYHLNFANPASFSFLRATGFELGFDVKNANLSDSRTSSRQWSGNMSYLALGFPLRNPLNQVFTNKDYKVNWGMGFAVMPNSDVSYNISRRDSLEGVGGFIRNFGGTGGTYKAIWSNSLKYGNASLGLSLGYLFGRIQQDRNIDFDERIAFDNQFVTVSTYRGSYAKLGFMYMHILNKQKLADQPGIESPKYISFGATYKPSLAFTTLSDINNSNFNNVLGNFPITDTIFIQNDVSGRGVMPAEYGVGLSYGGGTKITLGMDYRYTMWSQYRNDANPESLGDTYRIAFGGSYRPNANDQLHFFNRVFYKFGVYYEQDPRTIRTETLDGYGLSLGLGLPFAWQRKFSNMNIGVTLGQRSVANVLSEKFANITAGFTFNDSEWFIKRKFN